MQKDPPAVDSTIWTIGHSNHPLETFLDLSVTDLRLCKDDCATLDEGLVKDVAQRLQRSREVILGVGLTRAFRRDENADAFHWVQVTGIHLEADPLWRG